MIKNLFISLLAVIAFAIPSSAGPPSVQRQARDGDTAVDFGMMTVDFNTGNTAGIYNLGFSYPLFSLDWSNGAGGFNAGLYVCDTQNGGGVSPLSGTTQCVSVSTLQTTDLTVESFKSKKRYIVIDIISAGTGRLTIKGSWDQISDAGGGAVNYTQPNPTPLNGDQLDGVIMNLTDPAVAKAGYGVAYGPDNASPGGGTFVALPAGEPDNMIGEFYNKVGINSAGSLNQYEHAFDSSWETAYRATSQTADETWLEHNIDIYPSQNRVVMDSVNVGFNPTVGTIVTFNNGTPNAEGYVVSWDSVTNTLEWRHSFGTLVGATTVTVTEAAGDGGETADFTVANVDDRDTDNIFRARQFEYFTNRHNAFWGWKVSPRDPYYPLRMSSYDDPVSGDTFSLVGMGFNGNLGGALNVANSRSNVAALVVESQTSGGRVDNRGSHQEKLIELKFDFGGTNNTYNTSTGILFQIPIATGAGSVNSSGPRRNIEIRNQLGYGSQGSALYVEPYTCGGPICVLNPGRFNNITMAGGNYNNGHLVLGGTETSGNHIYVDASTTSEVLRYKINTEPRSGDYNDGAQAAVMLTGKHETTNVCASAPEAYTFYNSTSEYFCYCDSTTTAKQMHSPTTPCF